MSIKIEVWGDYACFTRPEMKIERVSYDVITPSAARGIVESIYWHPGLKYKIEKIYVLNPIKFTDIKRNEVKEFTAKKQWEDAAFKGKELPVVYTDKSISQRASHILKDVHYIIESSFEMTEKASESDNPGKFQDTLRRRLRRGQCYSQPYLGCREFSAHFCEYTNSTIKTEDITKDLGYMLYDFDYSDKESVLPKFFRANIVNGVIDCSNVEVVG